jgi:glycosyltransferase involved in cell wall biosynthesis
MHRSTQSSENRQKPRYSIVIPTYNRPESLRSCLSGIVAMACDRSDYEVIVVDDASDHDTAVVVDEFRGDLNLCVLHQEENRGPAAARNRGARQARGDYLFFLDDDCIPCRNWLTALGHCLDERPHAAVGGTSRNGLAESLCSEAQQMLLDFLFDHFNSDPENARFCATNNLAIPRADFLAMGGFDTAFRQAAGEDREFCSRWIRSGARLAFVPDAPVYHQHVMGPVEFVKLHFRYGRGAFRYRARAAEDAPGSRFEPLAFYFRLVLFPFSRTGALRALPLSALQVLSQIAHTSGYVRELLTARKRLKAVL